MTTVAAELELAYLRSDPESPRSRLRRRARGLIHLSMSAAIQVRFELWSGRRNFRGPVGPRRFPVRRGTALRRFPVRSRAEGSRRVPDDVREQNLRSYTCGVIASIELRRE